VNSRAAEALEVKVGTARELEEGLNAAVRNLQLLAGHSRNRGILVTRLEAGHYMVALSEQVPFGLTREQSR
jgi:hypothetical protein